ncbi:hypothetical protein MSSIH_1523 [Methanosarcina siciliae HI350]|uniref:Cell surface protein n=1 Tax=Methanosarcina siciliae HI350 TaxID=1434119 RepID=A0A0E3PDI0_9EURY|nr:hypothetical protein [Methanosarcina siciliae]AKB32213.1 hypothetical protein MSSIH_1523 [Methanosarcina siciliae HI350]
MKDDRFRSRKLLFGLCFAIFFTVTLTIASAESEPSIEWQKCLGGSGVDAASNIHQTSDGGYIVAGSSYSSDGNVTGNHGITDYWIVKLDTGGNIEWQKCLGGSSYDKASSIHQTSDGGYIVAGGSYSKDGNVTGNHGSSDYWIVKLDTGGDIEWQKCLGGSIEEEARSIHQTSDGGYIVAGGSYSKDGNVTGNHGERDYWVVKLEPDENEDETDLSILDINPVQVIYGCDIDEDKIVDLVAGKPIAVDVGTYLHVDRLEDLDLDQSIAFELLIDGQTCGREEKTIRELEEHRQTNIIFYPNQALEAGEHTIEAKMTPDIDDWDKDNNMLSETVEVKDTNDLYLVYVPIDETELGYFNLNPSSYGPIDMEEYASTVEDSGRFINATYPISKLTNTPMECKYYGSDLPSGSYDWLTLGGVVSDMLYIWEAGEFFTLTFADRSVGIVPDGYFEYHHIVNNPVGLYLWPINAGLVEVGYPTTTAHEIGHTYGLRLPVTGAGEEYYLKNPPYANGIWVSEKIPYTNELCFMNYAPMKYSLSRWVCDEDYEDLFKSFSTSYTPTTSLPLTNVILCSGIVYKNDTIDLMPTYFVENGITDKVPSGDYSLKILDMNKDVLDETDFDVQFFVTSDSVGTIETDVSGFAFVANYPEEASTILIQHEDKTLVEFNPHSKLLHDAIDSIPNEGFVKNPEESRKALHAKINAFEKMLEEGSFEEAQVKLEDDIEDKVKKWVVDNYQKDNPLQLSKEEVLYLINEEEDRLKIISGQ